MMVEKMTLGSFCFFRRGAVITAKNAVEGDVPVISGGQKPSYYHNEANRTGQTIVVAGSGAYAGFVSFWDKPIFVSDAFTVEPSSKALYKYVYYYLKLKQKWIFEQQKGAGVPHVHGSDISRLIIPLPSVEEQIKIVAKLDTFTSLVAKLDEEIELRKQQLVYYHNHLIDELVVDPRLIGDLFDFKNGLNKEKKYFGEGTPIVNYTDVYHYRYLNKEIIKGLVTLSASEIKRYAVKRGDVFFTRTSETKEEVGFSAVILEDIPNCTFSGFLLRARPKTDLLLPEYCKYCFSTNRIRTEIIRFSTYTTRALTNGTSLSKIKIPLPCKEKQLEIVEKLDAFTSLISKLQEERDLRQKQYEYYREKLLTFE